MLPYFKVIQTESGMLLYIVKTFQSGRVVIVRYADISVKMAIIQHGYYKCTYAYVLSSDPIPRTIENKKYFALGR